MSLPPALGGQAVSLTSRGGAVFEWRCRQKTILYPRGEVEIGGNKKMRGGSHWCFPNFGTVAPEHNLPPHGPLRNVRGSFTTTREDEVFFPTTEVLGPHARGTIKSFLVPDLPEARGFTHTLYVEQLASPLPVTAGVHPYFCTPEGVATVTGSVEGDRIREEVSGLLLEPKILPMPRMFYVNIPGLGTVEIMPLDDFWKAPSPCVVLWRDSLEYICVELALARPEVYGMPECPKIEAGDRFRIGYWVRFMS